MSAPRTRTAPGLLLAVLLAQVASAQSLGELGRQARQQKADSTRKVWTNEDLGTFFPEIKRLPTQTRLGSLSDYAATPLPVVEAMLKLAQVGPDDLVFDLGSGDGRIVIMAAERFGARGVGIELDSVLVANSRLAVREKGLEERVKILEANFLDVDFSPATVVTIYLPKIAIDTLRPHLEQHLRPGTRVVVRQLELPTWTQERQEIREGEVLYLYRFK
ncbi:MAG: class I SAM-dependent methyltransferase [Acidobacteria bacterium]|nr:class I SAM-dependent methyltransferase [Acidobacteriota bacterium]